MSKKLLLGVCSALVSHTEAELGIHIVPQISVDILVGSRALIQDMKRSGELVILLKPGRKDHQYLIAQGCMSALASREKPFHLRNVISGKEDFVAALTERGVANAETVARQLTDGAGSQLRGAPLLALSAQKIYADYPELRDDQLNYFKLDCAEGQLALSQVPPEFEGRLVDAHLAMNGATALVADYLFQNTNFYDPYSGTATDNLATGLVEDLYLSLIHISEPTRPY